MSFSILFVCLFDVVGVLNVTSGNCHLCVNSSIRAFSTFACVFGCYFIMSFFRTFVAKPSKASLFSAIFADRPVQVERDIAYGRHSRHFLDIYRPIERVKNAPIVIFLYGGGWDSGERQMYGFVGAALAASGFIAVIPDYRLYPEVVYPGYMKDAALAYDWVVRNLAMRADGRSRIFVMGHSAGAHMGALLAYNHVYLQSQNPSLGLPDGFIGLSGPYAFDPTTHELSKHIFVEAKSAAHVQPVHQVAKGAPPALMFHGKKDPTVLWPNALQMRDALIAVGTPAEAIEYENLDHIGPLLVLAKPMRWRAPVFEQVKGFICRYSSKLDQVR